MGNAKSQNPSSLSKSKNDGEFPFYPQTDPRMSSFSLPPISPITDALRSEIQKKIDSKTKPLGSLGQLETLAAQIATVQNTLSPRISNPKLFLFAADHGITDEPVSLYPKEVTWQMVNNFLLGGACANVFSRYNKISVEIVDAGIDHIWGETPPNLTIKKMGNGTQNFRNAPAMDKKTAEDSIHSGIELIQSESNRDTNFSLFGEMGIGNTSSASLVLHCLSRISLDELVGRGTGLNLENTKRKSQILKEAKARTRDLTDPIEILSEYGGFEIGMMAGAMLGAAHQGKLFMVDGFIATASYLLAETLSKNVKQYAIFSHTSDENGHRAILKYLGVTPLLNLNLRLGEGSGALCAFPLVEMAVRFFNEMASFSEANVSESLE